MCYQYSARFSPKAKAKLCILAFGCSSPCDRSGRYGDNIYLSHYPTINYAPTNIIKKWMSQRTMERGANAVVGYSLTDAQIFGEIGFAALSPSVYHNKQFSSATYMQQIGTNMSIIFCTGQGLWTANSTNLLIMRRRMRDTFAIENRLGAPAFGYCLHWQMPICFSFRRVS